MSLHDVLNMPLPRGRIHRRTIFRAAQKKLTYTRRRRLTGCKHCLKIHLILRKCQRDNLQLLLLILFRIPYPIFVSIFTAMNSP